MDSSIYPSECHWTRLSPELVQRVASFCHPNVCAAVFRFVDSETAAALRDYKTLTLGLERRRTADVHRAAQPWPCHAFVAHWDRPEPWRSLSLPQRERLLCLAASSGHAASLDAVLGQCGCALMPEVLAAAAAAGNLAGCEQLLREGCPWHESALAAAAQGGHLPVLQLLFGAVGDTPTRYRLSCAAEGAYAGGQLPILHWLQQPPRSYSPMFSDAVDAAEAGQVAMMEQLLPQVLPACYALSVAGGEGSTAAAAAAAATAGPAAEAGGGVDPPNSEQAHRQLPRRLEEVRRLLEAKMQVLAGIAEGCPVEVLRRHYDLLWRPVESAAAGAEAGDPLRADLFQNLRRGMSRMLSAAAGSPTPCWAAKLDSLLGSCGPEVTAGQVLRYVYLEDLARRPDFLTRLKHLRAAGLQLDASAAMVAARYGHADALTWLWSDECGLPARADRDVF